MTAPPCLCPADFIVARGFSTETHGFTSHSSSAGEVIHAKEMRDFKTTWAKGGFGEILSQILFYRPEAGKPTYNQQGLIKTYNN